MSPLNEAMIINAAVLFAVLTADLGPHRTIGTFRILRPLVLTGAIVPLFVTAVSTTGTGVTLAVAGIVAGLLCALIANSQMTIYRSSTTGKAASRSGPGYSVVWVVVIGARAVFSYGAAHWFGTQLSSWCTQHDVTANDITNALVLMAIAMTLTRTVAMAARARTLPAIAPAIA